MPFPALLGPQKCTVLIGRNRLASSWYTIERGILVLSAQYGQSLIVLHTVVRYGLFYLRCARIYSHAEMCFGGNVVQPSLRNVHGGPYHRRPWAAMS